MRAWVERRRSGAGTSGVRTTTSAAVARTLVAVALALVACTPDPEPAPAPLAPEEAAPEPEGPMGVRVGVVLPAPGSQEPVVAQGLREQLAALGEDPDAGVLQLRSHPVPSGAFAADVVGWLAERRIELVCALGDGAEAAVVEAAALYRGTRFCALPVDPPPQPEATASQDAPGESTTAPPDEVAAPSDGVLRVGLRAEELGELVGVAARAQADGDPVGLVLGGGILPGESFRAGLLVGLAGTDLIESGGAGPDAGLVERAEAVVEAGAGVVVLDGAEGARAALAAVGDRAAVFGPDGLDASRRPPLALGWTVRWDLAMARPLALTVDALPGPGHVSLGLADGVFEVVPGPDAADGVADALGVARAGIVSRR